MSTTGREPHLGLLVTSSATGRGFPQTLFLVTLPEGGWERKPSEQGMVARRSTPTASAYRAMTETAKEHGVDVD